MDITCPKKKKGLCNVVKDLEMRGLSQVFWLGPMQLIYPYKRGILNTLREKGEKRMKQRET